jgi:hypothetical protein
MNVVGDGAWHSDRDEKGQSQRARVEVREQFASYVRDGRTSRKMLTFEKSFSQFFCDEKRLFIQTIV